MPYPGPVAGVTNQYIAITQDSINVSTHTPNWFIHTNAGVDAINVSQGGGTNVLDGGTNSNFLVGATTTSPSTTVPSFDQFVVDDRAPAEDIWSTMANFHNGDTATIFGITQAGFGLNWEDNQGATGFTGLTLHVTAAGHPTASLTLSGYTTADLNNGRLSVSFGRTSDLPNAPGADFMLIRGTA
jgi:hypothetical protein